MLVKQLRPDALGLVLFALALVPMCLAVAFAPCADGCCEAFVRAMAPDAEAAVEDSQTLVESPIPALGHRSSRVASTLTAFSLPLGPPLAAALRI